jgi:alpha-tubulin suppressor-like RCC1 family protein
MYATMSAPFLKNLGLILRWLALSPLLAAVPLMAVSGSTNATRQGQGIYVTTHLQTDYGWIGSSEGHDYGSYGYQPLDSITIRVTGPNNFDEYRSFSRDYSGYDYTSLSEDMSFTLDNVPGGTYTVTTDVYDYSWDDEYGTSDSSRVYYESHTVVLAACAQTITFGALANKIYGDAPFALSATASSGLPITYASSNPTVATVSGNTVTVIGVGTVTITASQAGNTIYSAASPVGQSFSVFNVTPPTITSQPTNQTVTPNQSVGPGGNLTGKIAAGSSHNLALHDDGTVWAWGQNYSGQLGDGTTTNRWVPVQVSGLTGCVAIAAGASHSLAVTSAGTVWAWGCNASHQLGDGTTTDRPTPVQVNGLSNIRMVAAGYPHSLALANDGTVWVWGENGYGELGTGTWANQSTPVQLSGLTGCVAVAAGWMHSLALKNDGTVWAWGHDGFGQLGDGTTTCQVTPVQVNGLSSIVALAAGAYHNLALKNDGTVWAWGYNSTGQLGDGTTTTRPTRVLVNGLTGSTAIAANFLYSWASKNDGTIWAWGYNGGGQLGDGTTTDQWAPIQVIGLSEPGAVVGTFTVVATGHPSPTYQWQRKAAGQTVFTNLTSDGTYYGTNTATLTVRALTVTMSGDQFRCVVSNSAGNVTSNAVTLTVMGPPTAPTITAQPQAQTVTMGATIAFNVTTSGSPSPTYQWRKNGINLAGATAATLTLTNVQITDAGNYTVVVTNSMGSITSSAATLTVYTAPSIPSAVNYAEKTATTVTLIWNASTDNVGVVGYQIYRGGQLIMTVSDTVFTDNGLSSGTAYTYTVKALNAAGNASAASTALTVTTNADTTTDSDRDGIPDAMEAVLGTNPSAVGSSDSSNQQQQNIHRPSL